MKLARFLLAHMIVAGIAMSLLSFTSGCGGGNEAPTVVSENEVAKQKRLEMEEAMKKGMQKGKAATK